MITSTEEEEVAEDYIGTASTPALPRTFDVTKATSLSQNALNRHVQPNSYGTTAWVDLQTPRRLTNDEQHTIQQHPKRVPLTDAFKDLVQSYKRHLELPPGHGRPTKRKFHNTSFVKEPSQRSGEFRWERQEIVKVLSQQFGTDNSNALPPSLSAMKLHKLTETAPAKHPCIMGSCSLESRYTGAVWEGYMHALRKDLGLVMQMISTIFIALLTFLNSFTTFERTRLQ
jgi:hypothetical protein